MNTNKTLHILNALIQVHNDRLKGYKKASAETEDADLKNLFSEFRQTSITCNEELVKEVYNLEGIPVEGTTLKGIFFRAWMDIKATLSVNNRKAILSLCLTGENYAVNSYFRFMGKYMNHLSPHMQFLLMSHYALLKADQDIVKSQVEMLKEYIFFLKEVKFRRR
jgi:uncharacterized protein (TIGR02284 family)